MIDKPLGHECDSWTELGKWLDASPLNINDITVKKYSISATQVKLMVVSMTIGVHSKKPKELRLNWVT